jgi:hypothetical protein
MRDCRHILKYHGHEDSRLNTVRDIVGEFRICTQYAADMWPTRAEWLKTSSVDVAKKLFMAPETLHALHCTVEGFIGKAREGIKSSIGDQGVQFHHHLALHSPTGYLTQLAQDPDLAGFLKEKGVAWPTTVRNNT